MATPFMSVRFVPEEKNSKEMDAVTPFAATMRAAAGTPPVSRLEDFESDEAAARFYLSKVFQDDQRPMVRSLTASQSPLVVPALKLTRTNDLPVNRSRLLRFEQTFANVPVFGSLAVVELDGARSLMDLRADVVDHIDLSPIASISAAAAIAKVAELTLKPVNELTPEAVTVMYYFDDRPGEGKWRLAFYLQKVRAAPPAFLKSIAHGEHVHAPSPQTLSPVMNYLIDAHDGTVIKYFSAVPGLVRGTGTDVDGVERQLYLQEASDGRFEMVNVLKKVKTYDLQNQGIPSNGAVPSRPVVHNSAELGPAHPAAVSAHFNAARVYDSFNSELNRASVDGKGMELVSVVNCTVGNQQEWANAVWWEHRMWYGQVMRDGKLVSLSRHLDIIAHELTHGITEYTCNLIYDQQSGALNESFSDIFGVIIKNWYGPDKDDVSKWDWQIGRGWRGPEPLRNMQDPTTTGDPDHMSAYLDTNDDHGGVHTNSNIHNKAAYNVFMAADAAGKRRFEPRDVAVLYYLCLARLGNVSTFSQVRRTLADVATTYFSGSVQQRQRVDAIHDAYSRVGIAL